tara:strand:- start:405 stop:1325 length:921 start_codon:yes stop_codon:yes gene_type:complete
MRVLVTGSTGVIGISLLKMLEKYASRIDATYYSKKLGIIKDKKINYISYLELINNKEKHVYDQIWHFATYGQPAKFIKDWKDIIKLNVNDLNILINLLKDDGHFYYASTSELYGNKKSDENTIPSSNPLSKRAIYTESKRLGEAILNTAINNRSTFFRICLAYSPNFKIGDSRVLYELIVKALTKKVIELLDDGSSSRQYIFIKDAIKMMEDIAFIEPKSGINKSGAWNISNPEQISILELAQTIAQILDVKVIPGEKNTNPFHALSKVEIIPSRYSNNFGSFKYTDINKGLKQVILSAEDQIKNL